jgi:aldehyde dehydrogenase (NAD+)
MAGGGELMNIAETETNKVAEILESLDIEPINSGACGGEWIAAPSGGELESINPADGSVIAKVQLAGPREYDQVVNQALAAFESWRMMPAPQRGEIVREIGNELRLHKADLGALVSIEMGKILAEGLGEVQEMIDIADFAVGLSRQLYGLTMHSERPGHRMYEQWHPLGIAGVISAFNFPVAVWSWNAMIAAVCGDCVLWKPSHKTPLTAIAVQKICNRVFERHGIKGVFTLIIGSNDVVGERMLDDRRVPLISFTGSTQVGHHVAEVVGRRFGRMILELGGNNAIIVMEDANLDIALRAVVFGAVGTAGQRCTSTRRLFLQRPIAARMTDALIAAYKQVKIGNPLDENTLMGPLVSRDAVKNMLHGLELIQRQGGEILYGGKHLGGCFVEPALVRAKSGMPIVSEEIFAPILYLIEFDKLEDAIEQHNAVPQGLSSAMFTTNLISAEKFLSHRGSDCGIANINIGTSGAEIGGAFGGEKETGGGREAGSDSWKAYMRRQTNTINWSSDLPLAQGIKFQL